MMNQPIKPLLRILPSVLVLVVLTSGNQPGKKSETLTPGNAALQESAKSITVDELKKYVDVLASDDLKGRETGKEGEMLARNFIASEFKKMGLEQAYSGNWFQDVNLVSLSWKNKDLEVSQKAFEFGKDFICTPGTHIQLTTNEIIFAGYGICEPGYNDLEGLDLKDKVVMIFKGEPVNAKGEYAVTGTTSPSAYSKNERNKFDSLLAKGAQVVMVIDPEFEKTVAKYGAYAQEERIISYEQNQPQELSVIYASTAVGDQLLAYNTTGLKGLRQNLEGNPNESGFVFDAKSKIDKRGKPNSYRVNTTLKMNITSFRNAVSSKNVVGMISGTDKKNEVLVISAHYDHLGQTALGTFYGADDNGSGTAMLMELAEAFAEATARGMRPRRTLLFLAFTGEEKGLLGSSHYVKNPVRPLELTVANINVDMIGRTDTKNQGKSEYLYAIGTDKHDPLLKSLTEEANDLCCRLRLDYSYDSDKDPMRLYYRSDHYNFAKNGVPVAFFFGGIHQDYHKISDTADKIEYALLHKRAQLVFHLAWELANRTDRLRSSN